MNCKKCGNEVKKLDAEVDGAEIEISICTDCLLCRPKQADQKPIKELEAKR